MIKVPANFEANQIIGSLAINRPGMHVKRSKIVTVRRTLWIFFSNLDFFSVFFIHMNHSTSKNTKKSVLKKSAYS